MKNTDKQTSDIHKNHTTFKKPNFSSPTNSNHSNTNSGFAGPLLIYENDPKNVTNETSDLQNLHVDHEMTLNPNKIGKPLNENSEEQFENENPLYHNANPYGIWGGPSKIPPKPIDENKTPSFIGPFNPDFKTPVGSPKPKKGNKTSVVNPGSNKQKGGQRPPFEGHNPFQQPQYNTVQRPDEILQIINQHPELANYPPGSVFEIHNYDPKYPQGRPQVPQVPYLMNQVEPGHPPYQNIPIDQIIKHVQNGQIPPGLSRPLPPFRQNSPQFAQNPNIFAPHGLQIPFLNGQHNLNQSSGIAHFILLSEKF